MADNKGATVGSAKCVVNGAGECRRSSVPVLPLMMC